MIISPLFGYLDFLVADVIYNNLTYLRRLEKEETDNSLQSFATWSNEESRIRAENTKKLEQVEKKLAEYEGRIKQLESELARLKTQVKSGDLP